MIDNALVLDFANNQTREENKKFFLIKELEKMRTYHKNMKEQHEAMLRFDSEMFRKNEIGYIIKHHSSYENNLNEAIKELNK